MQVRTSLCKQWLAVVASMRPLRSQALCCIHRVPRSLHGSSVSQRQNYLDLDPTYRDAWGQPLLRMTFDFPQNDLKMAAYVTAKAVEIGKAMGAGLVNGSPRKGP